MKGINSWHFHPYRPFHKIYQAALPFICRLAPGVNTIELEWFDKGDLGAHTLKWREKGSNENWNVMAADAARLRIEGLKPYHDYELCIERKDRPNEASAVRYARTGEAPGTVVNYLHPEDEIYAFSGRALCSPCIIKLNSGALLASMDLFAPGAPQNLTLLFRSDDRGKSWRYVNDLFPCYWATLFLHRDRLYMLGCTTEYGDLVIGVSDDEGYTWSKPSHLFVGSSSPLSAGWQRTPMPVLKHNGRIYTSIDYGAWKEGGHCVGVLSVHEDADLLDSSSWCCSELTAYDPNWPGAPKGNSNSGLIEGNMLVGKDGKLLDLFRIDIRSCEPSHGVAAILEADLNNPEAPLKFQRFVNMPSGSNSKSHVLYDEVSDKYYAIGNICVNPATPGQRNVLALQVSDDLYSWKVAKILLDYRHEDPGMVGFQYISFIFDGDDILYLSRTAINQARNFHDANHITFHVVENFRQYA